MSPKSRQNAELSTSGSAADRFHAFDGGTAWPDSSSVDTNHTEFEVPS